MVIFHSKVLVHQRVFHVDLHFGPNPAAPADIPRMQLGSESDAPGGVDRVAVLVYSKPGPQFFSSPKTVGSKPEVPSFEHSTNSETAMLDHSSIFMYFSSSLQDGHAFSTRKTLLSTSKCVDKNSDTYHGQDIPPVALYVLCGHVILAKPFENRLTFPDVSAWYMRHRLRDNRDPS